MMFIQNFMKIDELMSKILVSKNGTLRLAHNLIMEYDTNGNINTTTFTTN